MRTDRTVTSIASGNGMTLGELRTFVAEMDAAGAADSTVISGKITFRGRVKVLEATAVRFGDPEVPCTPG